MVFTDFPRGLTGAADYLKDNVTGSPQLSTSVGDIGDFVLSNVISSDLKEIICSLMAGRGLMLPNIQICISLNLKELLGSIVGKVTSVLYDALSKLDQALDRFMSHLNLDAVLGRINGLISQVTNIANMINFCSSPIDPIRIPNVLENAMGSFLGAGKGIMDSIGSIFPDQIGGCLIDGSFNCGIFQSGILKTVCDNLDDLDAVADTLIDDINDVVDDIDNLIDNETNVPTSYDNGGSDLSETPRETHTGIGTLYNAGDEGVQGATDAAVKIKGIYDSVGDYPVEDSDGNVYGNILELICDEDLMRILRREFEAIPEIATQEPVRNYCGEIVGYTKVVTQQDDPTSQGTVPDDIDQPGWNAGGLPTNPTRGAAAIAAAAASTPDPNTFDDTVTTSSNGLFEVVFNNSRQTPPVNTLWFATITAVGRRSNGSSNIAIKMEALVHNDDGVVTVTQDASNRTEFGFDADTVNYDLVIDVVDDQFRVRVQGDVGHEVDWKVNFKYIETP